MKLRIAWKHVIYIVLVILLCLYLFKSLPYSLKCWCEEIFGTESLPKIEFLKDNDLTELDSKVIIGRAPGACYYGKKGYRNIEFALDRDIKYLINKHNVTTIIDLRSPSHEGAAIEKEYYAALKNGISYINLGMEASIVPTDEQLDKFFKMIKNSAGNVYIHCHAGRDRTGIMSSCYLTKQYHYSQEKAFVTVFDKREVPRLKYMRDNHNECQKLYGILDELRK